MKFIGNVDEYGLWSRVLTSTEVTEIWNNSNGLSYPFGITPETPPIKTFNVRFG